MNLEPKERYLLKALESISRRTVIVSPNLTIINAPTPAVPEGAPDPAGKKCHEVFFGRSSPCDDCGVREAIFNRRPVIRYVTSTEAGRMKSFHRHIIPVYENEALEFVASIDFDPDYFTNLNLEPGSAQGFLGNLIQSSVDGIIAADLKGRILIFNEAAAQMTGYSPDYALINLNIRDIYPGDGAREVMQYLRGEELGGKGKLKSFRTDLKRKDGSKLHIELSAAIVYECGEEVATAGFFYDLSEKLDMETKLRDAQIQLLQAEKMSSLGKLSAGVAHQLNNPLGSIVIFSHILLEEYDLPESAQSDLRRILGDAERCQSIVQELLDFARQSKLEIRPYDLNRALSRTIFLLNNQPLFKNIEVVTEFDPELPLARVDLQQLNHVFMNLVLNAADAMAGEGRLALKTGLIENGKVIRVEISDTGPGILGDVLPHIFEPFFTTKEQGRGTGLGLSVAYGVIENHNGTITALGNPGQGATFVIELPITPENEDGGSLDEAD